MKKIIVIGIALLLVMVLTCAVAENADANKKMAEALVLEYGVDGEWVVSSIKVDGTPGEFPDTPIITADEAMEFAVYTVCMEHLVEPNYLEDYHAYISFYDNAEEDEYYYRISFLHKNEHIVDKNSFVTIDPFIKVLIEYVYGQQPTEKDPNIPKG